MALILGQNHVTREALDSVVTPEATKTFKPIPHSLLVSLAVQGLADAGFEILEEDHVLHRDGLRYFGGFALSHASLTGERRRIVFGLRNANDKAFAAAACIGNSMMVCSNLCFSSERVLSRRHTKNVMRDLPAVIASTISGLITDWNEMEERIEAYEAREIGEAEAAHLTLKLIDAKAIPARDYYNVIQFWRNPEKAALDIVERDAFITQEETEEGMVEEFSEEAYKEALASKEVDLMAEFGGGTLWGLYNAVTHVLKGSNLSLLPQRTMNLQALFDATVGLSASVGEIIDDEGTDEDGDETEESESNFSYSFSDDDGEANAPFEG